MKEESQLSAMRSINKSFLDTRKELNDLVESMANKYNVSISSNHAVGNLKNEILNCIASQKPDIIVLGKRKPNRLNLLGDSVTELVMDNFDGAIMIASEDHGLEPNDILSLGVLNTAKEAFQMQFAERLMEHSKKPFKTFKTQSSSSDQEKISDSVDLVFDYGRNSITSMSNYLAKSDVNLLCLNRSKTKDSKQRADIKNVINQVNISVLISEC